MAMKTSNIIKTDATSPKAIITDADYRTWIRDIASRYRQSQIRAAVRVNSEMLHYYWQLGADIHNRQFENRYGSRFYANASRDLRAELGVNEGLSETTLKYTKYFYELYAPLFPNRHRLLMISQVKFFNRLLKNYKQQITNVIQIVNKLLTDFQA